MQSMFIKPNIHDLHRAISVGCEEDVQIILDLDNVSINATVCGTTALSLTLFNEKLTMFKLLLHHKCYRSRLDINKVSKDEKQRYEPPLVTACRLGNREAIKLLVKKNVNLEGKDSFQHTALWMATRQRFPDVVQYLLESGARVNPTPYIWTHSPLFFAVKYSSKRTEIAEVLLQNGADVNIKGGPSLLFCAIVQGDVNIARMIVEAGYNVSKDGKMGQELEAGTLTRSKSLISWLMQEHNTPANLQRQCRTVIRSCVSSGHNARHVKRHLECLPLPKSIIAYITLQNCF